MILKISKFLTVVWGICSFEAAIAAPPNTGISGVYEVVVGVEKAEPLLEYFAAFGFDVKSRATLTAAEAENLYGVASSAKVYRLQNGKIDTHGLLRLIEWETPTGPGVGFAPPETIGQRMAVMRTRDIVRLHDVFTDLRNESGEPWLPTEPVYDDLYDLDEGKYSITNRRVGVREMAVYGKVFNHVFFQRYGYEIPGYGTTDEAPLQTSEFTHHDFIVTGDLAKVTAYYEEVLGFKSEADPVIDGEWQPGPKAVFQMEPGEAHWYRGFVSPNNICGKLKFISPVDAEFVRDRSDRQKLGELGITMHTLFTPKLEMVHGLAAAADLVPTDIAKNEFGEPSFRITGPDGATWQVIKQPKLRSKPVLELEFKTIAN